MQERMNDESIEIDLLELAHVLLKKAWLIILCFVVGAVAMAAYTKLLVTPLYKSTATLYIMGGSSGQISISELQIGTQLTQDFQEMTTGRTTLENVISKAGMEEELSYEELLQNVSVENPADTRFLNVSVTNPDPETAKVLANELASEISDRVVTVMNADKPTIAEKAIVAKAPVSPNLLKNIMLGGLLGLFLSAAVIVVLYLLDDTIKDEEDVKKYLGINVLAALPDTKEGKRKTMKVREG